MTIEELLSHCFREEFDGEAEGQVSYTPNDDILLRWDGNDSIGVIEFVVTAESSGEDPACVFIQLENTDESLCYLQAAHLPITVWVRK